jgi:hypothetical protein|tara:strand:+ start:8616 stop:10484 length:1869 start_codon:yes stop_codon:yes gene_type:complete
MTWLINTAAESTLTIGGTDYSNNLITFQVTDSSIIGSGIITTQGRIQLGELPGQTTLLDYGKTKFARGAAVTLDLTIDGTTRRHPRGSMIVIDSSYNNTDRTVEVNIGCLLTMYGITDEVENIKNKTIFDLDDECKFNDLSNALVMEQRFIYVDGNGTIQKRKFYDGDGLGSNLASPAWVSVRDHTALSSQPLGVGGVVPDKIVVTYTWLTDEELDEDDGNLSDDSGTRYTQDTSESFYWLEHPANLKRKQKVCSTINGVKTCEVREIFDGKRTFSVSKTTTDRTYYGGPGGSTSEQTSVTVGPQVELNGAYYGELYSYELARNGGNPSGVQMRGLDNVTQGYQERTYEYGAGGEVKKTVDKTFKNVINAMNANDWRASNTTDFESSSPFSQTTGGVQRGFLTSVPTNSFFLQQQVTTVFEYYDDRTVETTTTLVSSADCNNTGIYPKEGSRKLQNLDATANGIETSTRRTSLSGLVNPPQPDRIGDGTAGKVTKSATVEDVSQRYSPTSAGSVVSELQVPYQVDADTEETARERAIDYAQYTRNLIEGDSAGIRVAEAMRPEIFNYYPGMPFAFYDRTVNKLVRLRMNACGWAVNREDAIMSSDGVFCGISNGQVNIGSNI